ncbi:hypothetical protein A8C32_04170 [Flavivirga aquatica]|uniref:Uncharacterized protein n=1 Tax=Flavivirga aquatica TaxID=1849968 RepID=A0A1E5TB96_9FLAO|nr:hypothetical protein [Flavivirga aquatica]OEK08652.1 hypothetical protein A8C32_04170 [Flavivirga aquatica]
MARNNTLFIYNTTHPTQNQEWTIYSEGVINETFTVGGVRKTFTLSLSGNVTIQFGVDDAVYLRASYNYSEDVWETHTDTPNDISAVTGPNALSVSSNFRIEVLQD